MAREIHVFFAVPPTFWLRTNWRVTWNKAFPHELHDISRIRNQFKGKLLKSFAPDWKRCLPNGQKELPCSGRRPIELVVDGGVVIAELSSRTCVIIGVMFDATSWTESATLKPDT
ncbi:hypothetical protein NL676_025374 [Syzygium grande]|nr:hypothetical protein NL676_025374 [Syzygium grande]